MVTDGAGIAIQAFTFIKWCVRTALASCTGVCRAAVTVVARPFVDKSVAVIIDAITCFDRRGGGVACAETILSAGPYALTGTEFIGRRAGRGKPRFDREIRALADTGGGDTLVPGDAGRIFNLLAAVA